MLAYRIAEHHVEGTVAKWQAAPVARQPPRPLPHFFSCAWRVQEPELRADRRVGPKIERPADIEHARFAADAQLAHESPDTPATEGSRECTEQNQNRKRKDPWRDLGPPD